MFRLRKAVWSAYDHCVCTSSTLSQLTAFKRTAPPQKLLVVMHLSNFIWERLISIKADYIHILWQMWCPSVWGCVHAKTIRCPYNIKSKHWTQSLVGINLMGLIIRLDLHTTRCMLANDNVVFSWLAHLCIAGPCFVILLHSPCWSKLPSVKPNTEQLQAFLHKHFTCEPRPVQHPYHP